MAIAALVDAPIFEAQSSYDPPVTITPRKVIMPRAVRIPVEIAKATTRIGTEGNRAQTELTLTVRNSGAANTEAVLLHPVPKGAIVKGFSYGNGQCKYTASLLPVQEIRRFCSHPHDLVDRFENPDTFTLEAIGGTDNLPEALKGKTEQVTSFPCTRGRHMTGGTLHFFNPRGLAGPDDCTGAILPEGTGAPEPYSMAVPPFGSITSTRPFPISRIKAPLHCTSAPIP